MYFRITELCQKLSSYDTLYLYGIGMYAMDIYPKLCAMGLKERIKAFIVSEEMEESYIDNIQVLSIKDLEISKDSNYIVLISVSNKYKDEITSILKNYKIENKIYLDDYLRRQSDLIQAYKNKGVEDYYNSIFDWYIEKNYTQCMFDYKLIQKSIESRKQDKKNKKIVFIIGLEMSMPRNVKIITALIDCGYDVSVLCYAGANGEMVKEEMDIYHINLKYCYCIEELMYEMIQYNPLIYYIEPVWGDCTWPVILIQHKEIFGKIVMTLYDVLNDGLVCATERQKKLEQYALENADGIVWRWFSKESLEEKGMRFKGRSIQFIDYCNNHLSYPSWKEEGSSVQIKFCYVRGNPNELFGFLPESAKKFDVNAKMADILKKISEDDNCCLHMFAWDLEDSNREECELLEKKYANFKVFWKVDHKEMLEKLKEYDYGIQLSTGGKEIPDDITVDGRYYGIAFKNSVGNKVFDYLDAGIPFIATTQKKLCEYLDQYHVMVKMDLSNFDIDFLRKKRKYYKVNVEKAKEEMSIKNHIGRLIQFFIEVADGS